MSQQPQKLSSAFTQEEYFATNLHLKSRFAGSAVIYCAAFLEQQAALQEGLSQITGLKAHLNGSDYDDQGAKLLWAGAQAWLYVHRDMPAQEAFSQLSALGEIAQVVDLTHARAVIQITGKKRWELLKKSLFIDCEELKTDSVILASLEHIPVLIHIRDEASMDLYVTRSFARALWQRLAHSASEWQN